MTIIQDIAGIVEILGILAVAFGVWLALRQFKLLRSQRRDLAIMECARSFEDREFTEAYGLITELKQGISLDEIKALGNEYELAALRVGMKFETIGLLVYKGVVPIDAMQDLVGGAALTIWNVLETYTYQTRKVRSHPTFWEWYQWLVDRLREESSTKSIPAFELYRDWKTPRN